MASSKKEKPESQEPQEEKDIQPVPGDEEKRPDQTVPGGAYLINGVLCDCNGDPL